MKLFVNDTPVEIVDARSSPEPHRFEKVIDARRQTPMEAKLRDDVLVTHADDAYIKRCLDAFSKKKVKKLDSITFLVDDRRTAVDAIKQQYKIIEAAGGVVQKGNKVLMIYRLGKWDLPKGKLERKEKPVAGGVREVEEECNVRIVARQKICHTWHTYHRNQKKDSKEDVLVRHGLS